MRVMIVVTHLLGTGHLARALTLGRAFTQAGDVVTLVSGGLPVPHFDTTGIAFVQLPGVRSNGVDFTTLLTDTGAVASPAHMADRVEVLTSTFERTAPDVVITELFPFGRRILRDEFRMILDQARAQTPRPLILSSIRDILAPPSKPSKAAFAEDMIAAFYDGVLVHSDADLIPLNLSWPVSDPMAKVLHYTGFVAPPAPEESAHHGEVLISAGGGSVGDGMFHAACDAADLTPDWRWRGLVGGGADRLQKLQKCAPANMMLEPPRPDFRTLLGGAAASVSMCGYNTAMDVLQTGVPAVLVPFDDGSEVEQGLRADALSALPGVEILRQGGLTGQALVDALRAVLNAPRRPPRVTGMDGATRTVGIARDLLERHSG